MFRSSEAAEGPPLVFQIIGLFDQDREVDPATVRVIECPNEPAKSPDIPADYQRRCWPSRRQQL